MTGVQEKSSGPVRVMVVDDSSVVRGFLRSFLENDPDIKVTDAVANGRAALEALGRASPDVVLLDLEMPVMDGMTALPLLLAAKPGLAVIIASTKTRENAALALRCLGLGAIDCLGKPSAHEMQDATAFRRDLVQRVKQLGRGRLQQKVSAPVFLRPPSPLKVVNAPETVALCSSTGGPQALMRLFGDMGALPVPVFVTQHMPAAFTAILAENIASSTGLDCREAVNGEEVQAARIYIAPGDFHLTVRRAGAQKVISLTQTVAENYCRPSADPMLRSLADAYSGKVLAVVLTGMGTDALEGCRLVAEQGGTVLAQDEASAVVWGMPGAVVAAGLCDEIVPLAHMAESVIRRMKGGKT